MEVEDEVKLKLKKLNIELKLKLLKLRNKLKMLKLKKKLNKLKPKLKLFLFSTGSNRESRTMRFD